MLGDEAVDGGLEVDDRVEDAALQAALGELGEETLDRVEPRTGRWREVEGEARVPVEPCADLGVFVSGVIVEDHMHCLVGRDAGIDGVEEADEFLMAMALHVAADDSAIENIQRREQGRGAVAFVIVRQGAEPALLQRQPRLRAPGHQVESTTGLL